MFEVGDKVKVVPTAKRGWNSKGRMEASIGMVGTVVGICSDGDFDVDFGTAECDTLENRTFWTYASVDLKKVRMFRGNSDATAS